MAEAEDSKQAARLRADTTVDYDSPERQAAFRRAIDGDESALPPMSAARLEEIFGEPVPAVRD